MSIFLCTVTGTIYRADGLPMPGQQITATIQSTEQDQGGQFYGGVGVVSEGVEAYTDNDGYFEIDLVRSAVFLLEIPTINLRKMIAVPAVSTVEFGELI